MRTKSNKRRTEIIIALSDMSRGGWEHSTPSEYERLERELIELDRIPAERENIRRKGRERLELIASRRMQTLLGK